MRTLEARKAQQRECMKRWREANPGVARARNRAHYNTYRMPYIARAVQKRAAAKEAVPAWLTKDHWRQIASFYAEAQARTLATGVLHVVDHIDALRGGNSCGLHVPWNLQVITHAQNVLKYYREDRG